MNTLAKRIYQPARALALAWAFLASATTAADYHVARDLSSPVTTPAWVPVAIGSGVTLGLALFKDEVVDKFQDQTVEHKPLGSTSKYGDYAGQLVPNALYCLGMWAVSKYGDQPEAWRRTQYMFLATLYAVSVTTVLKYSIREPRPDDGGDFTSFPSGHSTSVFAFAAVVGVEHGYAYGIPAYLLAAFAGYSRINDNRHRLHDVTAGATIGIGYGLGLAYFYGHNPKQDVAWMVLPEYDGRHYSGITLRRTY